MGKLYLETKFVLLFLLIISYNEFEYNEYE